MKKDRYTVGFHLMPPKGWLNDPNGLCQFEGMYHVFFQYSPESPLGGQKYWGHYRSTDLLRWEFAGVALSPDQEFDRDGVYSGSAIVIPKSSGKMRIYYTGNVKMDGEHDYIDSGRGANVICTESTDGIHFSEKELLLTNKDYPSSYTCHVRDPKVYFENERYYMVLGGRKYHVAYNSASGKEERNDRGAALLYASPDGKVWKLEQEFETEEPFGYMWECPDIFSLGTETYFSFCPQGLAAEDFRYQNTDQTGYVWMKDVRSGHVAENFREWDMGFEFYAPQTFEDEAGRRIMIGWAGLPELPYENPTVEYGWQHCLTIPRELTVTNGRICQNPVKELENLREREQVWQGDAWREITDFSFWLKIENMESEEFCFSLGDGLFLKYENKTFTWMFPDGKTEEEDWGRGRRVRNMKLEKLTDIQILCDSSILEVFVNGGSGVMCGRFYPAEDAEKAIGIKGCNSNALTRFWHMKDMEVRENETITGNRRGTD